MKRIIDYIPLFTICLLYFGFCNLHYYYSTFKIEIYNYITSSEILLSFFPTIVVATTIIYGSLYNAVLDKSNSNKKSSADEEENPQADTDLVNETDKLEDKKIVKPKKDNLLIYLLKSPTIYLLLYFILSFIIKRILLRHYYDFELQWYNIIVAVIFCAFIMLWFYFEDNTKVIRESPILFSVFLIVYIGTNLGQYRTLDAKKIKKGISDVQVSFSFNNKQIKTSKSLVFVGQTQNNLFLYNIKDSTTFVYKTSTIDSLNIK